MERLKQDIKNHSFQHLYLLFGEEAYLRKSYKKSLIKEIIGEDTMNYTYYEGKDINVEALIDQAETLPFFNDKRLIVVENSGFFKNGNERIQAYFSTIPEYLYLVFVEKDTDKRSTIFKAVKSKGCAVEMQQLTPDKIKPWAAKILNNAGKRIKESDLDYFLLQTGNDMVNVHSELDKLISFMGDRTEISRDDINAIVTRQINDTVFAMVKAMGEQNQSKALNLYYDLLLHHEAVMKILALISRQFNLLLQTRELLNLRYTNANIASKIGVNPYFIGEYVNQAKRFDFETLKKSLEACVNVDEDIKKGKMKDQLALELLIVKLSDKNMK